ncbi:hypothetical protein JCM6882_002540 [Rhodosporidiobolus microsporus]
MLSRVASKRTQHSRHTTLDLPPSYPPPSSPPTDPLPLHHPRPTDVLLSRLHELKRLCKSLQAHFTALAAAEEAKGRALEKDAQAEQGKGVRKEWLQGGLFLPPSRSPRGEGGWAEWCGRVREETGKEAEAHLRLARGAEEEVIDPLRRLYLGVKAFIADMDKAVNPLAEEVVKERETSVTALTHLATSLASFTSTPLFLPASEDPLIVRSTAELQMRHQVQKENDLLRAVLSWQEKTGEFEKEVLERCGSCWKWWAEESAKVHLDARQSLVKLTQQNAAIAPDAEWRHFLSLNHLLPPSTPARDLDLLDYPHRNDAATRPLKEGVMERKKKWTREWKECFFVLTPAGYLHEYRSPSTPLSKPHLSLFLPACTVLPLSPAKPSKGKGGKEKPAEFVIEGRKSDPAATSGAGGGGSVKVKGMVGIKAREVGRVYRARSETEAAAWWPEIEKLSKTSFTAHPGGASPAAAAPTSLFHRQGPAPTAVQQAGLHAVVEHGEQTADEDEGEGVGASSAEEDSPVPPSAAVLASETGPKAGEAVVGAAGVVGMVGEAEAHAHDVKGKKREKDAFVGGETGRDRKESMVTAFENLPLTGTAQLPAQLPAQPVEEKATHLPAEPSLPGGYVVEELENQAETEPVPVAAPVATGRTILTDSDTVPTATTATAPTSTSLPPPPQHPTTLTQPHQPAQRAAQPHVLPPIQTVSAAQPPAAFVEPKAVHPAPAAAATTAGAGESAAAPPELPPRQGAPSAPVAAQGAVGGAEAAQTTSTLHPPPGEGTAGAAQPVMVDSSQAAAAAANAPTPAAREKRRKGSWFGFGKK